MKVLDLIFNQPPEIINEFNKYVGFNGHNTGHIVNGEVQ